MAKSYDINEAPPDDETPYVKHETERAKLYLQKFCPEAGDNLYNHISEVLAKILAERPNNAFATFDEYSKKLRDDKFRLQNSHLRDLYVPPPQYNDAKKLINLFKVHLPIDEDRQSLEEGNEEKHGDNNEAKQSIPNLFDLFYYFQQVDVGLPRTEIVLLNLSIRKLIAKTKIEDVRFWGKILGRPKHYFIIEANLPEQEIERRLEKLEGVQQALEKESTDTDAKEVEQENAEKEALETAMATKLSDIEEDEAESTEENDTLNLVFPPIPKNTWTPLPEVSPEKLGTGLNAKVFFVCNSPGLDNWVELPTVTPQQIVVARQIVYLFTGNLESEIHTFPSFPGREKNYLRAQIARIGAATHVSPISYFTFHNEKQEDEDEEETEDEDEEEEEEGEGEAGSGLAKNRHYEQPLMKDLIDPSMSSWCHHSPYILKQGRMAWLEPGKADDEDGEDEEEEEEEEDEGATVSGEDEGESKGSAVTRDKGFEKEIGPPLLNPLSGDVASDSSVTPWMARQSSRIQPDTAVALIRSNVWPGAFAFAADKKFGNVYIGWGYKQHEHNYSPPAMPAVQDQYRPAIDSELTPIRDPSFEEEEAYRLAHLPPADDEEDEEEEEEEEDEESDVDDAD